MPSKYTSRLNKKSPNHSKRRKLSAKAYQTIVYDWNKTTAPYPHDKTIHQLFELQVKKTPNKTALVFEDQTLTYKELNERANQLAHYLRDEYKKNHENTLKPDTLIAICLERSLDMVIAILAVLKAGAAYVPLDPEYPMDRIQFQLEDTQAAFLVTNSTTLPGLTGGSSTTFEPGHWTPRSSRGGLGEKGSRGSGASGEESCGSVIIYLDDLPQQHAPKTNPKPVAKATDLAYVIYTSGTTGKPKGVMVTHLNVVHLIVTEVTRLNLNSKDVCLGAASISFDTSVWEIFTALSTGATLHILSEQVRRDSNLLLIYLKTKQITVALLAPTILQGFTASALPYLRVLVTGIEVCDVATLETLSKNRHLFNAYGPSECTVYATSHLFKKGDSNRNLGHPISNTQLYVLDEQLNPVSVGVIGELYISGSGMARGYLNQPKLTKERFILNPFRKNSRMYKTGDLVRWLPSGEIEYVGRNDSQVKIRGHRIELEEIEAQLYTCPGVQKAVVLPYQRNKKSNAPTHLIAYYVGTEALEKDALREQLSKTLADYMVPSDFIALSEFPLTINGKLDQKALPAPDFSARAETYKAPRNEREAMLCHCWAELLGVSRIGLQDDFFRLGGHSILAIQASHQMSEHLGSMVRAADIFRYPTIAAFLSHLSSNSETLSVIESHPLEDLAPLSFAQERLWFIEQYEQGMDTYHIPIQFELPDDVNIEALNGALQALVERHTILRTTFVQGKDGVYYQRVHDKPLLIVEEHITRESIPTLINDAVSRVFDLTKEHPIRALLYKWQEKKKTRYGLLLTIHHVAFDGWSNTIFTRELQLAYESIRSGKKISLKPLSIQYKDFAVWHRAYIENDLDALITYWKKKLKGHTPLALPTNYSRPAQFDYSGKVLSFTLPRRTTKALHGIANDLGVTLYTLFLTPFAWLLSRYTGQEDLLIGTVVANRQHPQLEELVGFFVNLLVLRLQLDPSSSLNDTLLNIQSDLLEAQHYQDLPFELLVDSLGIERDSSSHPLSQVMFTVTYDDGFPPTEDQLGIRQRTLKNDTSKFDICFFVHVSQDEISYDIEYASALFKSDTIEQMGQHYGYLLKQMPKQRDKPLLEYPILTIKEQQKILYDWNMTEASYSYDKTIPQLFEEQVKKTPNSIALVFENQSLTYKELNQRANQLAHFIRGEYERIHGETLKPDTLIALCLERSIEMVIAILGVLKAGGAYVPLDPEYPAERIQFQLEDTQAEFLLTNRRLGPWPNNKFDEPSRARKQAGASSCVLTTRSLMVAAQFMKIIYLDQHPEQHAPKTNLKAIAKPTDLAYVIYTSGTTGKPKGVMIEHRGVINHCYGLKPYVLTQGQTVVLQYASLVFDASVLEIFNAVLSGSKLILINQTTRLNPTDLLACISKHKVNFALLPPSILAQLPHRTLPSLKTLLVGGEACSSLIMNKWSVGRLLINAFGPTESTVTCCMHPYQRGDLETNIGKPCANSKLYILDKDKRPVPIGAIGELYIGGSGVARGYLNRAELTAERFTENPFEKDGSRLYKTGDLVRYLPDGNIQYIGRNDFQFKIRGHRIELGEIETAILQIDTITQAVVIPQSKVEAGQPDALVAYYITDGVCKDSEGGNKVVSDWITTYDDLYQKNVSHVSNDDDFTGWNSAIHGGKIPLEEMKCWQMEIIDHIKALHPRDILEIGVGSGLLMYPLLPKVNSYTATDISTVVIERHQSFLNENPQHKTVLLEVGEAIDTASLFSKKQFDTVILNSVCQYFPHGAYFEAVFEQAVNLLKPGGVLFLGDIRDLRHQRRLIELKLKHEGVEASEWLIQHHLLREPELLISPDSFSYLSQKYQCSFHVLKKQGKYCNELSEFRYDVIVKKQHQSGNHIKGIKSVDSHRKKRSVSAPKETPLYNVPYGSQIKPNDIQSLLEAKLPHYMIPSAFIPLISFPSSINGKLDRKALPKPDFNASSETYKAPRDEREALLCHCWSRILGVVRVGLQDDFFKLGGHSILAIQASHQMSEQLGCVVRVIDIFNYRTIEALISSIKSDSEALSNIHRHPEAEIAPLSFAQERLFFIEQYEQGTNAYHVPLLYHLSPDTDPTALKQALQSIVKRHTILRTTFFQTEDGINWQKVNKESLNIKEVACSSKALPKQIKLAIQRPFDLTKHYPIRVLLFKPKEDNVDTPYTLLIIFHHMVFDEWSASIFERELQAYYESILDGKRTPFKPLPIQYKDYAIWHRAEISHQQENLISYWHDILAEHMPTSLPTDYPRPAKFDFQGNSISFDLSDAVCQGCHALADETGVTHFTILLTAFSVLLSRYTAQDDILIGTPVTNREHPQLKTLIGFFVNTLPLRLQLRPDDTLNDTLLSVQNTILQAQKYQDLPFEQLVSSLDVPHDPSRHPLFQIMFSVQYESAHESPISGVLHSQKEIWYPISKFDLGLRAIVTDNSTSIQINYATTLFKQDYIERFARHYESVLSSMMNPSYNTISEYPVLLPEEYQTIVYDWNKTEAPYAHDKTIHQLFEEQVKKTPNSIALLFENQSLTYKELNQRANQLAHFIRGEYERIHGETLKPDTLIALCLERSIEMVIAILGVLKAGGAYVPLDPEYPAERIQFQLEDTQAAFLVTNSRLGPWPNNKFDEPSRARKQAGASSCSLMVASQFMKIIYLDQHPEQHAPKTNPKAIAKATDLAYVIYTSGTTGKPKGVMTSHQNVVHYTSNVSSCLSNVTRVDYSTNLAFDLTVTTSLAPLMLGKCIIIYPGKLADIESYATHLASNQVEFIKMTPSYLTALSKHINKGYIKRCVVGGEKLDSAALENIKTFVPEIYDEYGPTESTVGSTIIRKDSFDIQAGNIGKAYSNVKCYILDTYKHPVPIGAIGELYIGGAGVARGYLNRPDLTSECFIPNPFATQADKQNDYTRLYKTGDLVRYLENGNIQYLGRNDFQVKIRGFRIELGEIENQLLNYPGVQQAVVLSYQKDKEKSAATQLVAYYVASEAVEEDVLRAQLSQTLPDYMMPNTFISLSEFPLTLNGKLDRKALPKPDYTASKETYAPPRTALEKNMCNIWADVLDVDRVGIEDNFFALGGNSILAMQLCYVMNKEKLDYAIIDIMTHKTIKNLLKLKHQNRFIKPIGNSNDSFPKLFFVHSVLSGSEIYLPLAEQFNKHFHCMGVENFHLAFRNNINSFSKLAKKYVTAMEETQHLDEPIHLVGWSLGGKIAMEMAYHLEQRGHKNITLFLLDTYLFDEKTASDWNEEDYQRLYNRLAENIKQTTKESLDALFEKEQKTTQLLHHASLSGKLKHAKLILCQALLDDASAEKHTEELQSQIHSIQRHVSQKICTHPINADHFSLLEQHNPLLQIFLTSQS